jgi:hypothetical protein
MVGIVGSTDVLTVSPGTIRLAGWALQPSSPDPLGFVVFVDDDPPAGSGQANRSRPDVGAAFPTAGPDHGFDVQVSTTPGAHLVALMALANGLPPTLLAVRHVTVP